MEILQWETWAVSVLQSWRCWVLEDKTPALAFLHQHWDTLEKPERWMHYGFMEMTPPT